MSFLSKLILNTDLMNLAFVFEFLMFFNFDKELLGMGSDLSAGPGFNEIFNFFPVFSVEFESIEELLVFFLGPSASSSALLKV